MTDSRFLATIFRQLRQAPPGEHPLLSAVSALASAVDQQILGDSPVLHSVYMRRDLTPDQRRALRDNSLPYEWTPAFRRWLARANNHHCVYCGRGDCEFHIDHLIPVSWVRSPGATIDNAAWACSSCNTDRGNKPLRLWLVATFGAARAQAALDRVERVRRAALQQFAGQRQELRAVGKQITARRYKKLFPSSRAKRKDRA